MTTPPTSDAGVLGTCACGGGPTAPNFDCERCRMVWTLLLMRDVRAAQTDYFHDQSQPNQIAAGRMESKIDQALAKLLVPPPSQQPDLDMQIDQGANYYTGGN